MKLNADDALHVIWETVTVSKPHVKTAQIHA